MSAFLPLVVAAVAHLMYIAIITTLWLTGQPLPPSQINSLAVSGAVSSVMVTAVVCVVRLLVTQRFARDRQMSGIVDRLDCLERRAVPQRVYVSSAPPVPRTGTVAEDTQGLGPAAIAAAKEINRRLNGVPEP